jgi:hypothetical protein
MRQAVLYARVSTKDQEREGYSIPAQLKLLREYAASHELRLIREFIDVETAKTAGRKLFGEMVRFLEGNPACRIVIVEKTDRLYRNFRDCVTLEDLGVEIHLPKEGQVISKDSKSQAKLVHGIQVVIASVMSQKFVYKSELRLPGFGQPFWSRRKAWDLGYGFSRIASEQPPTLACCDASRAGVVVPSEWRTNVRPS